MLDDVVPGEVVCGRKQGRASGRVIREVNANKVNDCEACIKTKAGYPYVYVKVKEPGNLAGLSGDATADKINVPCYLLYLTAAGTRPSPWPLDHRGKLHSDQKLPDSRTSDCRSSGKESRKATTTESL